MTTIRRHTNLLHLTFALILTAALGFFAPSSARAEVTALKQAIAESAASDADIAQFYRTSGYKTLWVGSSGKERKRREQLLRFLGDAEAHGLPASRYDAVGLRDKMQAAGNARELGQLEVELSRAFLAYAREVQTGVLVPSRVDRNIVRQVPYRDRASYLVNFSKSSPAGFFRALPPQTAEYAALMKEKLRLERQLAQGGWGPTISSGKLEPGQSGPSVVTLRNRLIAMGYLRPNNRETYDDAVTDAVQQFQLAHGLTADGVAGGATIAELNKSIPTRLQAIHVAMERERWMNRDRGQRHVLVNIPDFTAKIIDNDRVTFETRSVVGADKDGRHTPEFSDVMEFMVVNPSWYVPRSIVVKEYLPALRKNANAVRHIEITDSRGRVVNRGSVNFAKYTEKTFPFAMRQPPSRGNALGLVKFMFPNQYNIYLHDTPAKNLFGREVRAFSHGCVRLADPFDFAYALLSKQQADPEGYFQSVLATGKETRVTIKEPVPVHITYRTAFASNKGRMQYRRDIYGRDARIWTALANAGVVLHDVRG
ncbi:murein L,D-transpeptidase [Aliishimia ponticola]|uniref:Murein L,D-transpeptidase n=1 Tax=Aliishimia ponticola TaxID=2499833 RepID=A0A4S4NJU1_9RHOB|nr:L,D-transpeptidase family protein [Aliishimia ponticola]THH38548.1 murein L,D-transpeptidase [Aliishimia ponticola]